MTTAALITKLKKRIEKEKDRKVLDAIDALLEAGDPVKPSALSYTLDEVAEISDRQIHEGRGLSLEQFGQRSDAFIKKLFAAKRKPRTVVAKKARLRRA